MSGGAGVAKSGGVLNVINVSAYGGPGRTRTCNQTVMSGRL